MNDLNKRSNAKEINAYQSEHLVQTERQKNRENNFEEAHIRFQSSEMAKNDFQRIRMEEEARKQSRLRVNSVIKDQIKKKEEKEEKDKLEKIRLKELRLQ